MKIKMIASLSGTMQTARVDHLKILKGLRKPLTIKKSIPNKHLF